MNNVCFIINALPPFDQYHLRRILLVIDAHVCERPAQSFYMEVEQPRIESTTSRLQVKRTTTQLRHTFPFTVDL